MKDRSFAAFIVGSFLICIPLAAYYAYAPIFVGHTGFEKPGTIMSFGQGSEILFMLLMPFFFIRLGVKWMLVVGMAAWVARYALFAGAEGVDGTLPYALVFLGVLLHGICYDFFFVTGFIYTDKKCSKETRGQAQGFLVLVTQGLGLGIGAQIMGRVFGGVTTDGVTDWQTLWLIPCIFAGVVMVLFALIFNDKVDTEDRPDQPGEDAPAEEIPAR